MTSEVGIERVEDVFLLFLRERERENMLPLKHVKVLGYARHADVLPHRGKSSREKVDSPDADEGNNQAGKLGERVSSS